MNNIPRQKLIEIIALYGPQTIDDPRRVEGLLRDFCGEHRREIKALVEAVRERMALDLRAFSGSHPPEMLIANLTRRLLDNSPMSEDMARWVVESWAVALGVIAAPVTPAAVIPQPPAAPVPTVTPPALAKPAQSINQVVRIAGNEMTLTLAPGVEMRFVSVPAGEFWMGCDDGDIDALNDEKPKHSLKLPEYWMGAAPVSNRQYQTFVAETKRSAPHHWTNGAIPSGKEQHPVVYVSWQDAMGFCRWLQGKKLAGNLQMRLPTEAEWEKAARGTDGRIFPWGNQSPDPRLCNSYESNIRDTTPVGKYSLKGDSPYGCADMAGNVWEWTHSLWKCYPYKRRLAIRIRQRYRLCPHHCLALQLTIRSIRSLNPLSAILSTN